ncbi:MAG: hypothetical protein H6742_12025 [Alphaproteobacteria bacterium]|nr:hypothetical protein [Alphaproteobacteria bacterium]
MRSIFPLVSCLLVGCAPASFFDTGPCAAAPGAGDQVTCDVPGFEHRPYDLLLPDDYDGETPVPVLVALHGGGGNKRNAAQTTCATGQRDDPGCLHAVALARGYALVLPSGTGSKLAPDVRTWNAGGGVGQWRCASGRACEEGIDDVAYFDGLLDDLEGRVAVGDVFLTGLSNGGAMTHRLACERSERLTAVAPIAGAMQLTTSDSCAPTDPVPLLHIHGTEDPCWRYDGGAPDCPTGQKGLEHVSVERTLDEWAALLGCSSGHSVSSLPDTEGDGTKTERWDFDDCAVELSHLRIVGGGHAWPDGYQYLRERTIGRVPRDWGNDVLLDWFDAHRSD